MVAVFDGAVLADYRAAAQAAIPEFPTPMAAKAVDVIWHRTSVAFAGEYNGKLRGELNDELNAYLGKEVVWEIYSSTYKMPCSIVMEATGGVNGKAKKNYAKDTEEETREANEEAAAPPSDEV